MILYLWFYRPLGGGYRLYNWVDTDRSGLGFDSFGSVLFKDGSMVLKPLLASPIRVPMKDVTSVVEMSTIFGLYKKIFVFYRREGLLCYVLIPVFPWISLQEKFPGHRYLRLDLISVGWKSLRSILGRREGKEEKSLVEGKEAALSCRHGGIIMTIDAEWPPSEFREAPEDFFPLLFWVRGLGVGAKVYEEALVLTVPVLKDFTMPKKDIVSIRQMRALYLTPFGINISHKSRNVPERIMLFSSETDKIIAKLKELGYPVEELEES
jgi:hypothetical protein